MILKFKIYGFCTLLAEKYWQYIFFSLYMNDFHSMVRGGGMNRKFNSSSKAVKFKASGETNSIFGSLKHLRLAAKPLNILKA